jgi:autotransporter-associated beta strand protein
MATLSGWNSYQGGTTVAEGTLVVAAPGALPSGTSLTVGAAASSLFAVSPPVQTPVALSGNGAAADVAWIDAMGVLPLISTEMMGAVVDPSQSRIPVRYTYTAPAWKTDLPSGEIRLSHAAVPGNTLWESYPSLPGPAVVRAAQAAERLAWYAGAGQPSNAEDSKAEKNQRIAVLDAILAQYGSS